MSEWQKHLEMAGAGFFQRYRKRLLFPGVVREIRRELPELSLLDVLIRVHAGRRLIMDGDDFCALRAIREGSWQRAHHTETEADRRLDRRVDRISRFQVILGSLLFTGFCMSYLLAAFAGGATT